jgi:hypothetical protein
MAGEPEICHAAGVSNADLGPDADAVIPLSDSVSARGYGLHWSSFPDRLDDLLRGDVTARLIEPTRTVAAPREATPNPSGDWA